LGSTILTEKLSLTASSLNFKQGRKFSQRGVSKARSESQAFNGRMEFTQVQNYAMDRIQQRFWWRTASKHSFIFYEDDMRQVVWHKQSAKLKLNSTSVTNVDLLFFQWCINFE